MPGICKPPANGNRRFYLVLLCTLLFLASFLSVDALAAQSGRRLPPQKRQPDAPPLSKTIPEEKKEEAKKPSNNDLPQTPVLIGFPTPFGSRAHYFTTMVANTFTARLAEYEAAKAQLGGEMNRSEASDTAKRSLDNFVVLLEVESDTLRGNSDWNGQNADARSLLVSYTLFEPKTGKVRTSGRAYPQANTADPMTLPQTGIAAEYRLRRAAQEAADRIANILSLGQLSPRRLSRAASAAPEKILLLLQPPRL